MTSAIMREQITAAPLEVAPALPVRLDVAGVAINGDLSVPADARGLVLFAHGSGSSRHSPRNRAVDQALQRRRLATLLRDLLTEQEDLEDATTAEYRFDIPLLADRARCRDRLGTGSPSHTFASNGRLCTTDRAHHGAKRRLAERNRLGHPHDSILHQSRWTEIERESPPRARTRQAHPAAPRGKQEETFANRTLTCDPFHSRFGFRAEQGDVPCLARLERGRRDRAFGLTPSAFVLSYLGQLPHAYQLIAVVAGGLVVAASVWMRRAQTARAGSALIEGTSLASGGPTWIKCSCGRHRAGFGVSCSRTTSVGFSFG